MSSNIASLRASHSFFLVVGGPDLALPISLSVYSNFSVSPRLSLPTYCIRPRTPPSTRPRTSASSAWTCATSWLSPFGRGRRTRSGSNPKNREPLFRRRTISDAPTSVRSWQGHRTLGEREFEAVVCEGCECSAQARRTKTRPEIWPERGGEEGEAGT